MNNIKKIINTYPKFITLLSGLLSGFVFAPTYFIFLWVTIVVLCLSIHNSKSYKETFFLGFLFGFGHFLTSIYWVSLAIMVYIDDFWWFIPIALFGLPLILGIFIGFTTISSIFATNTRFFALIFAINWTIFEYIRSFILTGFPWNLAGYSLSFSYIPLQIVSKISIYGLSFCIIYIFAGLSFLFVDKIKEFKKHLIISFLLILIIIFYGLYRSNKYPTEFTNHKIRIVQASIKQEDKWKNENLLNNLNLHIELSNIKNGFSPDIILWSESAVPFLINDINIRKHISKLLSNEQIIITGSVSDNNQCHNSETCQLFVSMTGIDNNANIIFAYNKRHLVPFGEYVPLKNLILIKKITHGFMDFSPGTKDHILSWKDLKIRPLICYEAIFSDEVIVTNQNADLLVNTTNDAWYGNIGPYQHFDIAKVRSIETGIPMIRVANNGISAIIDPIGRTTKSTLLNQVGILDGYIPKKLSDSVISNNMKYKNLLLIFFTIIVILFIKKKIK
jgi:apolipoprotein N-acyltransferase